MTARYWEDYTVGEVFETEPVTVTEEQIIAFAERYDPQVFHTDPVAAKDSVYGGLIASGHQTIGLAFAQFVRLGLFEENALGGPGMDEIRWTAPVRPDDTLHTTAEVVELRASKSRPDRGIIRVKLSIRVGDQDVSSLITTTFLRRRPPAPGGGRGMTGLYLEDYTVGRIFETEPVKLDADEIIWFAEQYDPQVFHTDPVAAKDSAFGEHVASGFQTVAIATGQFIRTGAVDDTGMGGPGLDEIRWTAPVRPGDSLYTTVEVAEARATRSNPGRGIVTLAFVVTTGSDPVLTFKATIFVRARAGEKA